MPGFLCLEADMEELRQTMAAGPSHIIGGQPLQLWWFQV